MITPGRGTISRPGSLLFREISQGHQLGGDQPEPWYAPSSGSPRPAGAPQQARTHPLEAGRGPCARRMCVLRLRSWACSSLACTRAARRESGAAPGAAASPQAMHSRGASRAACRGSVAAVNGVGLRDRPASCGAGPRTDVRSLLNVLCGHHRTALSWDQSNAEESRLSSPDETELGWWL